MSKRPLPLDIDKNNDKSMSPHRYKPNNYSWIQNIQSLSKDDTLSDTTFIIGKEKVEFKCIRALFACQSDVFRSMLYGKFKEASSTNQIVIPDITANAFRTVQKIFYGMDPDLALGRVEDWFDVLDASEKYLLTKINGHIRYTILNELDFYIESQLSIFIGFQKYPQFKDLFIKYINKLPFHACDFIFTEFDTSTYINIEQMQLMIQNVKNNELRYKYSKRFCVLFNKKHKNQNKTWQQLFKTHFRSFIDFSLFHSELLLTEIKDDNILSDNELIEVIKSRKYSNEHGFTSQRSRYNQAQITKLQIGDQIDIYEFGYEEWCTKLTISAFHVDDDKDNSNYSIKCNDGEIYDWCVNDNHNHMGDKEILILPPGCVMQARRERLLDIKEGDKVYARTWRDDFRWKEIAIEQINGLYNIKAGDFSYHINDIDVVKRIEI